MSLEKIFVMQVAAQLTTAVLQIQGKSATPITIDPTIQDPQLRAANLEGWEEFRIFYAGLIGALGDDKSFPPPKNLNVGNLLTGALPALLSGLPGGANLAGLLTPIIDQILKSVNPVLPIPIPSSPLPNPGDPIK